MALTLNIASFPTLGGSAPIFDGVAPCHVFLTAKGTTSDETDRPYHDIDYLWLCPELDGSWDVAEDL